MYAILEALYCSKSASFILTDNIVYLKLVFPFSQKQEQNYGYQYDFPDKQNGCTE